MASTVGSNAVTDNLVIFTDPHNIKSLTGRSVSVGNGNQLVATSVGSTRNDMQIDMNSPNAGGRYASFHDGWNLLNGQIALGQAVVVEYDVTVNTTADSSGNSITHASFMATQFGPYDMISSQVDDVPITVGHHTYAFIANGPDFTNGEGRRRLYIRLSNLSSGRVKIENRKIYKLNTLWNMGQYRDQNLSLNNGVVPKKMTNDTKYFHFDGVDDFLYTGGYRYTRSQGYTNEGWFRFYSDSSLSWHGLFGRGLGDGGYIMFHNSGDICWYSSYTNGSSYIFYDSGLELGDEIPLDGATWNHIVQTYDESDENMRFYLNGELKVTRDISGTLDVVNYSGGARYVGSGAGRYGKHDMGIYRHYSKCLSAEEAKQNFEANRGMYGV